MSFVLTSMLFNNKSHTFYYDYGTGPFLKLPDDLEKLDNLLSG